MTAPAQQLIDGKLSGASDGATYPILNPATGEVIGQAPDSTAADVDAELQELRSLGIADSTIAEIASGTQMGPLGGVIRSPIAGASWVSCLSGSCGMKAARQPVVATSA